MAFLRFSMAFCTKGSLQLKGNINTHTFWGETNKIKELLPGSITIGITAYGFSQTVPLFLHALN